jgi:hypothetical protein
VLSDVCKSAHCQPATKSVNALLLDSARSLLCYENGSFWLKHFLIDRIEQSCYCYCFERRFYLEFLEHTVFGNVTYMLTSMLLIHKTGYTDFQMFIVRGKYYFISKE